MPSSPTTTAFIRPIPVAGNNQDILQVRDSNNNVVGWIDGSGFLWGNMQVVVAPTPVTKTLYVDGNRQDTYSPTGTIQYPFKTIMAAVNQVITNSDNSIDLGYLIDIAPGVYKETISLNSPELVNLTFDGHGASESNLCPVTVGSIDAGGANPDFLNTVITSTSTNTQLVSLVFKGIQFASAASDGINLVGDVNGTGFGSFGIVFHDCVIRNTSDAVFNNIGSVYISRCQITSHFTITNVNAVFFENRTVINTAAGGYVPVITNSGLNKPSGFSSTAVNLYGANVAQPFDVQAGSILRVRFGTQYLATLTIEGTCEFRNSTATSAIVVNSGGSLTNSASFFSSASSVTVNSGGSYTESGFRSGSLTVNSGGTYAVSGTMGAQNIIAGLSVYANNAAAIAGGLIVGQFYRTGSDPDTVCVVH